LISIEKRKERKSSRLTEGKGADIDKDNISETLFTGKDTSLNSSSVGDSLIRVNSLGRLLSVEVLLEELLNAGDTGRTSDETIQKELLSVQGKLVMRKERKSLHNVVNSFLLDTSILENLLDGLHSLAEEIHVELFELGASEGFGKILSIEERFDFDLGRHLRRKSTLGLFDFTLEFTHGTKVLGDILSIVLALPGLDKVVDNSVVEIFSSEVSVTSGRKNLEDTVVDREKRDIECSSSEIIDNDGTFSSSLVESVGDSGGGRFVDDTEDVETSDRTGILGSLTLSVVEAIEMNKRGEFRAVSGK